MKNKKIITLISIFASAFLCAQETKLFANEAFAENELIYLEENYTNSNITASQCYEYNHVANGGGGTHGLVPGEKWGDPINAGIGYITYKVVASSGMALESLKIDLNYLARTDLKMKDDTTTNLAAFNVYYSTSFDSFDNEPEKLAGWTSSSAARTSTVDFTSFLNGESIGYIKVEFSHNVGSVNLSSVATKLYTAKIYGTEVESNFVTISKEDTYTSTSAANCKFDSYSGLGGFGNSNGIVPTTKWTDPITTCEKGFMIYSLTTPVGATFTKVNVSFSGRVWGNGSGTFNEQTVTTAGCNIKVYVSQDVSNFGSPIKTFECNNVSSASNYSCSDDVNCIGASKIYIKIEFNHPEMKVSLSQTGTRLYSASIAGTYDKRNVLDSIPFSDSILLSNEIENYETTGNFVKSTSDGHDYLYLSGNKAYMVIPFSCDSLYKFYNISFSQLIRCTTYNDAEQIKNALTYYVSADGENYELLESLDTDSGWARKNIVLDLSNSLRGKHNGFIKIEYNWAGKEYSHDWIEVGDITLTGDLLERDTFDIFYENMFDGVNNPDNPVTYSFGSEVQLKDPSRINYDFDGWFADEDMKIPFAGISSTTKGDIHVYAKWNANYIPVTLNAGSGHFEGSLSTKEIAGHYDMPLYRENLEIPTSDDGDFINWYKESTFETPFNFAEDYGESDKITESIELFAKFGESAKVTYDYNDGKTSNVVFYQEVGQKASTVTEPVLEGYKFGGWLVNNQSYSFDSPLTGDIVLTAKWYKVYSITYTGLTNATHSNVETFTNDLSNIPLTDAVRPGYRFVGWFMNDAQVTSIDTSKTENIVLEARWEAIVYQVSYNLDSHVTLSETPSTITYEGFVFEAHVENGYRISKITVNNVAVSMDNNFTFKVKGFTSDIEIAIETVKSYVFNGSINIDFADETDLEEHVYDCNNVISYTGDSKSERYGWLVPQDYSKQGFITYAIDAGEGQTINSLLLTGKCRVFTYQGSNAVMDLYYSLDGIHYDLLNSYSSTTSGETMTDISLNLTPNVKGEQKVFIKYVIESGNYDWVALSGVHASMSFATVTVNFMDGENLMYSNADQIKGGKIVLLDNPSKAGYTFLGWYLDSSFRTKVTNDFIVEENTTLYAKWSANTYSILFVVGEGGDIGDNVESFTPDEEVELSEAIKKNCLFVGWYTNPDFIGDPVTKISKGTTKDVTLYAKFEAGIIINYELNGGVNSELNPEVYFVNGTVELFDPYREGYVFGGWFLDSEFKNSVSMIEGGDGNPITLYAMWIEDGEADKNEKGCGGSIIAVSSFISITCLVGLILIIRKKKVEESK